jgi:hypothetical protein
MVMKAEYRTMHDPVLKIAKTLEEKLGQRTIAVLIPELVKQRWYQAFLHANRARRLRRQLLKRGDSRLTIIGVPWYLDRDERT